MFAFLKRLFRRARPDVIRFDQQRVVRERADGQEESVLWSELTEVDIVTTDGGPFTDDLVWVLLGERGGCLVPSGAQGASELLARLQQLPNFDNMAVIAAMGSTDNARFLVWQRQAEAHLGSPS